MCIRDRYNMYVWRTPGNVHENDTYHLLNTYEYYVVLTIGAAVALPWSLVCEIKVGKIKEPQSGTITFGLKHVILTWNQPQERWLSWRYLRRTHPNKERYFHYAHNPRYLYYAPEWYQVFRWVEKRFNVNKTHTYIRRNAEDIHAGESDPSYVWEYSQRRTYQE